MSQDIVNIVLGLSSSERKELIEMIRISLELEQYYHMNAVSWYQYMREVASRIVGVDNTNESRNRGSVLARSMVAFQLKCDGMNLTNIGKLMGKDHSTVSHMINKMIDIFAYPNLFYRENAYWNQFKNIIDNETDR